MLAAGKKLSAVGSVQPGITGAQLPSSTTAKELKLEALASVQPRTLFNAVFCKEPKPWTAKSPSSKLLKWFVKCPSNDVVTVLPFI